MLIYSCVWEKYGWYFLGMIENYKIPLKTSQRLILFNEIKKYIKKIRAVKELTYSLK